MLALPLKHIFVVQPFGVNFVDFYQKMGLTGHPGVDFRARHGCPFYFAHDGVVTRSGEFSDGGLGIEIWNEERDFGTFYYHLERCDVKIGDKVKMFQQGGLCDNTGKYTTGDHLHFEYRVKKNGVVQKLDPAGLFIYTATGESINSKDWDKSRCYHRCYRGRPKGAFFNETKILGILGKKGIYPTAEKINALVYGSWDLETVQNPAMYEIYSQLTKGEYLSGIRQFQ